MRIAARLFLLAASFVVAGAVQARGAVRVPSVIGDNMVLQQGRKARVWGTAEQGARVTVSLAGQTARVTADARGRWEVFLGPLKAGGPHTLNVSAGADTLSFRNVLVGEVWVCSGQSNMEWPLAQAEGGREVAAEANYAEIRLFTVEKRTSDKPLEDVKGRWVVATPEEAARFSAVGFYFGRMLQRRLRVPVGLIHTSWGGTPAESWMSRAALEADSSFRPILERYDKELRNLPQLQREHERAIAVWEGRYVRRDSGNEGEARGYADPARDAEGWRKMRLPQLWESAGLKVDGAVWFRRTIDIPAGLAGRELVMNLGPIDDFDTTYFNGVRVGATGAETPYAHQTPRGYRVPASLVRPGANVVAVRVFDRMGGGGFAAPPGTMSLAATGDAKGDDRLSLEGEWDYKAESIAPEPVIDYAGYPGPRPGPDNQNNPAVLYNAMLAPLSPYAVRGAIWYQGESNAGRAYQYRALFPAMIRDWRARWNQGDFPFYFVQLANWRARKSEPSESDWAELREAQLFTLRRVPHTGMAVAVDIGEADDIHPRNKRDVGERLARWALSETYGQRLVPSGPLYDSHAVEGHRVRLRFKYASGLKTSDGSNPKGFAVAGADRKFVWAEARVEGDTVVVWNDAVPAPAAVRYAWADNPAVNLYNGEGLPASPFRTDDWPGITAGKN